MNLKRVLAVTMVALVSFVAVSASAKTKDSGTMVLHSDAIVGGMHLGDGTYSVQWQTHSPEATVSFSKGNKVVAKAEGKLVDRGKAYPDNQVVYSTDGSGARVIQEIRFQGSSQVIVFSE